MYGFMFMSVVMLIELECWWKYRQFRHVYAEASEHLIQILERYIEEQTNTAPSLYSSVL